MRVPHLHHGLRAIRPTQTPSGCRTFLSGIPEQKIHLSHTLPYSQKQLYDLVSDVSAYHRFVPFCTSSKILSRPPPGSGPDKPYRVELAVGFMGIEQRYVSNVFLTPYERVEAVAADESPIFTKLRSVWTFKPLATPSDSSALRNSPSNPLTKPSNVSIPSSPTLSASAPPSHPAPQTQFSLDLEFGFINPLHAALSSSSVQRVSQKMVEAFVSRCIQIYGNKDGVLREPSSKPSS
ncbi:hypothetical protein DL93DRAFT_2076424 [Clavulina sp. PMI_390]|nr:hypothetical protein DL93DRAFT_2076424 [Clavulina sp. PMI_390]